MNPFQAHNTLLAQYETQFLGQGDPLSLGTLEFTRIGRALKVPVTHTEVAGDVVLVNGGLSPATMVERAEIRAELLGDYVPKKTHRCTLTVRQGVQFKMQVWSANLLEGGESWRLVLVDENYKA